MNGKKTARVVLDAMLTVMIVAEMFIQFTGVFLHEVIGFAFFATVVVHIALSAKWIKNTASTAKKGKMTARRTALAIMGILLAVNVVVLGISSVAISTILESAGLTWTLGSYATWKAAHAVSSYTLCALVVVHLGMHWAFLASAFKVPYDPSRRRAISTGVHAVAAVGALALGAMAVNQIAPLTSGNGNGNTTQTQAQNGTASNSSSSASSSAHGGKRKDEIQGVPSNTNGATGTSSSGAASTSNSPTSQGSAPSQSSSNGASGSADSLSTASGICTLCHKKCPLSAPKCDKPYREGLL